MSITDASGQKIEIPMNKTALMAQLDVDGLRRFVINLLLSGDVPIEKIARSYRCSVRTIRRNQRLSASVQPRDESEGSPIRPTRPRSSGSRGPSLAD
jgi:hypothetical protein